MRWAVNHGGSWYRGSWCSVAAVLGLFGVVGSCVLLGPGGALLLGGLTSGLTALSGWRLRSLRPGGWRLSSAATSLLCGLVALAVVGLVLEFGAAGLWLGVLVVAAGWPVLRGGRRVAGGRGRARRDARPVPGTEREAPARTEPRQESRRVILFEIPPLEQLPPASMPEPSRLPSLSTAQLCWAWRVSYVKAHQATCGSRLEYLAELRRGYLDELERRDPIAFSRWFPTARAASDPARFFCSPPPTVSAADDPVPTTPPLPATRPVSPNPPMPPGAQTPPGTRPVGGQRKDANKGSQTSGAAG